MYKADVTVTLYNALYDEDAGYDTYKRTVLSGVSWFSRTPRLFLVMAAFWRRTK